MTLKNTKARLALLAKKLKEELKPPEPPPQARTEIGESPIKRIPTGIEGFDDLIQGGFVEESIVVISGGPGTGKTLMSLQYLYKGATVYNEPGIFISFAESKKAIFKHGLLFGWDFEQLEKDNKFAFIKYEPHEVHRIIQEGGGTIKDTIDTIGARRLVVDSITAYTLMFENAYKENEAVLELFSMLRRWGLTSVVISEVPQFDFEKRQDRGVFLADGVVFTYYVRRELTRARALEVIKMRDTKHVERVCPFMITAKGIVVFPDAQLFE